MKHWLLVVALVLAALGSAPAVRAAKEHVAERFDIQAAVQPDGSLEVTETITFRFSGGDYTYVTRTVPAAFTDGIEVLGASMDGRALLWGDEEGQVEVDYRRSEVRVRWRFPETRDRAHDFTLRYRMAGVVRLRQGGGEDWFAWAPFPRRFDYPIREGQVRLTWMPELVLRRQPHVTGPVQAVSPLPSGIRVDVANLRQRDEDVEISARFEPGMFLGAEPQWQRDEARSEQMSPAFIAGACMIIAATILALWIFFLKYRRDRPDPLPHGHTISDPPEILPPALAGAISHGRVMIGGGHALATVFDLAGRGAIRIEERPPSGWSKSPRFVVQQGTPASLAPHEEVVRAALFSGDERPPRLDKAMRALAMKLGGFKRAVTQELGALGYLDEERADGAKGLAIAGGAVMFFAAALFIFLVATNFRLGRASLMIPGALFVSGITMLIIGASFSTLSARGWRAALRWKAYRRHLKEQARSGHLPAGPSDVSRLLPVVTALGLAPAWHKALKQLPDAALPPWLATLGGGNPHAAYTALLASSVSSSGAGAGTGGGGGVAGGGSSSAG